MMILKDNIYKNKNIFNLFIKYKMNQITLEHLYILLDEQFIRGNISNNKYLGYDYKYQEWIEININDL